MRAQLALPILALTLAACRAQPADAPTAGSGVPAAAAETTATAEVGTTESETGTADTGLGTSAADDTGVAARVTNVPQLQLRTLNGSGAGVSPIQVGPGRELRLQRVTPSQNELRLRTNVPNQVRQPVRQGLPDSVRTITGEPTTATPGTTTPTSP